MDNLKIWDGTFPTSRGAFSGRYPVERSPFSPYYIDPAGNVRYTGSDGQLALWCSGARLLGHFRRLASQGVLVPLDNSARM